MKFSYAILLFCSFVAIATACPEKSESKEKAPATLVKAEKQIIIKTVGDKTMINNLEFIYRETTLEQLEEVLGKARRVEGSEKVYFDKRGITATLVKGNKLDEVDVYLSKKSLFTPPESLQLFSGEIHFKGIEIKTGSKVADLLQKFKDQKIAESDERFLPTIKLEKSAWWFYSEKKENGEKMSKGENIGIITLMNR